MNIGDSIRKYRKKARLSQRELGERLGVSQQHIAQYENGKRTPKYDTIKKISSALNVSVPTLIERSDFEKMVETEPGYYRLSHLKKAIKQDCYNYSSDEIRQISERIDDYISESEEIQESERDNYLFKKCAIISHEILDHLLYSRLDETILDIIDLLAHYLSFNDEKKYSLLQLVKDLYGNKNLLYKENKSACEYSNTKELPDTPPEPPQE